jgi:hypothetical protein
LAAALLGVGLGLAACGADGDVRAGDAQGLQPDRTSTTTTVEPAPTTTIEPAPTTTATEPTSTTAQPTTTATSTTRPALDCVAPSELPLIAAADDTGYDTVQVHEGLGAPDNRAVAMFTGGGAVAAQLDRGEDRSIEYRIGPAGGIGETGTIDHAVLYDLIVTDTGPKVLYGELSQGDGEPKGSVRLFDIGTGSSVTITASAAPEYSVYAASVADGIVVTSAISDLTENISTWALDGSGQVDRYTPVRTENYGLPPFYGPAVPSPDGTRLAWLEGPDVVGADPAPQGDWQLVVADAFSGEEQVRLVLAPAEDDFSRFDWDGDWAVLSRGHGKRAVAIHTSDEEPKLQDICTADGRDLLTGTITIVPQKAVSANARVALDRQVHGMVGDHQGDRWATR